jgi:H+/Cl- antiporter ClcA
LLAVACGVGLLTGLGVGAFNIAEHGVHDLVFLTTTVYSPDRFRVEGMRDVRPETWVQAVGAVAAPTAAGFAVTGLRFLAGGFDGEEAPRWGSETTRKHESESAEPTLPASSAATAPKSWVAAARVAARPALKAAAAVVTLGAGASLGPEGPSVEIGASIAGSLHETTTSSSGGSGGGAFAGANESRRARRRRARLASRRLGLVAAGSAAGISAGFGAPIAGLFFAFESVLQPASARRAGNAAGDVDDLGGSTGFGALTTESVILASVLAAVVSGALLGEQPAFIVPAFELKNLAELPLYLPLGLLCGATAVAFRSSSAVIGRGFAALERGGASGAGGEERGETANGSARFPIRVPREWHAPLGGAAFGVVATLFPEVTYQGFDNVNSMLGAEGSPFRTPYSPSLLTGLVLVKLAATALCRQSGLVGGVYAPSLFMGAALGSAYGAALVPLALAGAPVAPPQAYALVGMAGVLAGICRVPLTAILLLFELTHDYRIIVPLMGTVGVASWVAGAAERGEGANVRERRANGQPPEQPSYVAVEVPKGKAEGVVGGAGVLSFDDDDDGGGGGARGGARRALDAARSASRAARVSDAVRTDAPRVLASASAMDAALAAREAVRDGSAARCAVVVDPDGSLRGVATARSMAAVIASGRGDAATAFEACDGDVPLVASSWTLREAEARMRARHVTLAAVVATVLDANESGEEKRAVLGVLEAGAAAAERDAAALGAALRAHEAATAKGRKGAKGRGANVPR